MGIMKKIEKAEISDPKVVSLLSVAFGIVVVLLNFTYLQEQRMIFAAVNLVAGLLALGVPLWYQYNRYKRVREIEEIFPRFLNDINQNINAGMTLPQAIRAAKDIDYGMLTPYVNEMRNKIGWGIGFDKILENFAKKSGSAVIKRTVRTINEAHRSGGRIGTVLEAVTFSVQEIEHIKKERSTRIYSQMINGYVIFFVFLGVMFGLTQFLIPSFQFGGAEGAMAPLLREIFRNLVLIQGFFAGLAIGKMAEGSFTEGLKHSLILAIVGYTAFIFVI